MRPGLRGVPTRWRRRIYARNSGTEAAPWGVLGEAVGHLAGFLRGRETVKGGELAAEEGGRAAQDNPTAHPEELVGAMLPKQEGRAGERGAAEKLGEGSLRRPPEGAGPVLQARGLSEDLRRAVTQPGTEWDGRSGL